MDFKEFPKIPRLKREIVITEKIDGTNACIAIGPDGEFMTQSRNRVIVPGDDNYGFAAWAYERKDELMTLGEGYHYGEWWGQDIGRKYGMTEKRFSLFNVARWNDKNPNRPACCHVVPTLAIHQDFAAVGTQIERLKTLGSVAAQGFMAPEGVIVYHCASRSYFKVTCEKDAEWKGKLPANQNRPQKDQP